MKPTPTLATALTALLLTVPARLPASEVDARIESSFRKSYVLQTYLRDDAILIRSRDGNAVLTGKVAKESNRDLAGEILSGLPGVNSVDNRLKVKGNPPAENSDKWIQAKVETVLGIHRSVNAIEIKVLVKDGVVTLLGQAGNQAQRDLVSDYAADVPGVTGLTNGMTIAREGAPPAEKMTGPIDDASITALVKVCLLSHSSTRSLSPHVRTEWGTVTLGGKAGNAFEKDLATKFASDVDGVNSVVNTMVVSAAVTGI